MAEQRATLGERLLLWSGYAAFFVFCFVLFAYWTFPYDRVQGYLISRVEAYSPGSKLEIGELSPYMLTGLTLSDVELQLAAEKGKQPRTVAVDEVTVSISPLAMLMGETQLSFDAEIGEGGLEGEYSYEKDGPMHVVAELDAVDVEALGLGGFVKVPLKGLATGDVDVTLAPEAADTGGMVDLKIADFAVGDGKTKVPLPGGWGGITVPEIQAGDLTLRVPIKEGVATVEKLEAKGKDLSMAGSGSIRLIQPFERSRADLTIGIKVGEGLPKREPKIKTVLEMPQVKRAIGSDGMLRFALTGPLGAIKAKPGAASGSKKARKPRKPPRRPKRKKK